MRGVSFRGRAISSHVDLIAERCQEPTCAVVTGTGFLGQLLTGRCRQKRTVGKRYYGVVAVRLWFEVLDQTQSGPLVDDLFGDTQMDFAKRGKGSWKLIVGSFSKTIYHRVGCSIRVKVESVCLRVCGLCVSALK